jgi:hypothetical protein
MPEIEDFLRSRRLAAPSDVLDRRMTQLFRDPPRERWWRRPMALWHGIAAAMLIGAIGYGLGRYQTVTRETPDVAKETVIYIIQDGMPGTRNAFDVPSITPGYEWWRQSYVPEANGGAT